MNWRVICIDKKNGALGIRRFGVFNRALLGKRCWKFVEEGTSFGKKKLLFDSPPRK